MVLMVTNINGTNFGGRICDVLDLPSQPKAAGHAGYGRYLVCRLSAGRRRRTPPGALAESMWINTSGFRRRSASGWPTSFVGKGTSVGPEDSGAATLKLRQGPDSAPPSSIWNKPAGDQIRAYDGSTGWENTLNVLGEFQLMGGDLDGARFDAQLSFPGQIKQILTNLKTGPPTSITDLPAPASQASLLQNVTSQTHLVDVVQGTGPRGLLVTLYFDQQSGLLLRELRYGGSPIGRVPTQIDFADYRDVNGIKLPFRITFAWLDGRDSIVLNEIRTNVPVEETKFGRPAPLKPR
jgi:hypothetical protein